MTLTSLRAHLLLLRCRCRIPSFYVAPFSSSASTATVAAAAAAAASSLSPPPTTTTTTSIASPPTSPADDFADVCTSGRGYGDDEPPPRDAADALRRWGGCSHSEVSLLLDRRPFLSRMSVLILRSKLELLAGIGLVGPLLVKVVISRPRLLASHIAGPDGRDLHARLDFLRSLFPASDSDADQEGLLLRAIVRNPSLLNYDVDRIMRPCLLLYESVGVGRRDFGRLLLSRPTVVRRSSLDDEKRELVRRTGLRHDAATYKYAVSIVAISRVETLRAKIANLEKFGFSNEEVMGLFARTPNILTLSIDKVQRNMTYLLGTIKFPPSVVLANPLLFYCNLDKVLRPRHLLGVKLRELGLEASAKGPWPKLIMAVRMSEDRFLEVFVRRRQPEEVVTQLMEYYDSVRRLRRLAESCKSTKHREIPY